MTRSKWNWMIALYLFAACTLIAVPAIAQQQVDVVNGKAHPVPTLEATEPYEDSCTMYFSGDNGGSCVFKALPPRKRLIVQEFDSYLFVEPSLQPGLITLTTGKGDIQHVFTSTLMGSLGIGITYATHQETRLFENPGVQPICGYLLSQNSSIGGADCQISGFLVDVP